MSPERVVVAPPNRRLYLLPFDHRGSFEEKLFGWEEPLSGEQTARIVAAKRVVYNGFLQALQQGVPEGEAGILVDEQFGAGVLREARGQAFAVACPAEKSGEELFHFEYGDEYQQHVEQVDPTYVKVLVRYNPEGDAEGNRLQRERLAELSRYLQQHGRALMFELLVPAEDAQLRAMGGDKGRYDDETRPGLMVRAIRELQDAGIEPSVWKIEGLGRAEDARAVVEAAQRGGREAVRCIILGRGADDEQVTSWLRTAAAVPGFFGFAVGRTTFWDALEGWKDGQESDEAAAEKIAEQYRRWVDVWRGADAGQ